MTLYLWLLASFPGYVVMAARVNNADIRGLVCEEKSKLCYLLKVVFNTLHTTLTCTLTHVILFLFFLNCF